MKKLLLLSLLVLFGCSKEDNTALIDSYTSQISSLNAQISQLNNQIAQSQSQITSLQSQLNTETSQSQSQIASLQSQVNSISGLEATIDNLNSQITDYQNQISSLQAEVNALNEQVSNNSSLQTTVDSLNAQIASKNAQISSLQAQITALENNQSNTSTDNSSDTDNWPDYHSQGHTMEAVSIWRLATRRNASVPESERFNIKIYPDALNPNKLVTQGVNQSGFMDIGDDTEIPFTYVWGNVGGASIATGNFAIDSSLITGVASNYVGNYDLFWYPSTAAEGETPNDYVKLHIPGQYYDEGIDNRYFDDLVFYRID